MRISKILEFGKKKTIGRTGLTLSSENGSSWETAAHMARKGVNPSWSGLSEAPRRRRAATTSERPSLAATVTGLPPNNPGRSLSSIPPSSFKYCSAASASPLFTASAKRSCRLECSTTSCPMNKENGV